MRVTIAAGCAAIGMTLVVRIWGPSPELLKLKSFGSGTSGTWIDVGESNFSDPDSGLLLAVPAAESLRLTRTSVTDECMKTVGKLTHLRILRIGITEVSDAGLAHLAGLNSLEDAGLRNLGPKSRLTNLLVGKYVTLAQISIDQMFPALEEVVLTGNQLDQAGALRIGRLSKLRDLVVADCGLDDGFAVAIKSMAVVKALSLDGNDVGDATAAAVAGLPAIYFVSFNRTRLTDSGLMLLAGAATLKQLKIASTLVTEEGIRRLRRARPDINIRFDG